MTNAVRRVSSCPPSDKVDRLGGRDGLGVVRPRRFLWSCIEDDWCHRPQLCGLACLIRRACLNRLSEAELLLHVSGEEVLADVPCCTG